LSSNDVTLLAQQPLNLRCLALTGTFETSVPPPGCFGCITGDFDGQGISYSALQWNFGQSTLQPLLLEMSTSHPDMMGQVFGDLYTQLSGVFAMPRSRQLAWARSIQSVQHTLDDRWRACFRALGQTAEFQAIATRHAASPFDGAISSCRTYGLESQRAAALLFDITVQNGTISSAAHTLIERDFATLPPGDADVVEAARMRIIANRIADTASIRWREDVRTRKLTIANGTGTVHGLHYDLAVQYGLTLRPFTCER
jgi:hypothetical protein